MRFEEYKSRGLLKAATIEASGPTLFSADEAKAEISLVWIFRGVSPVGE